MITIYLYDENNNFTYADLLSENEPMPNNATKVGPQGFDPFKFDPTNNVWVGVTKEEWEKTHPLPDDPEDLSQTVADQSLQIMMTKKENEQLKAITDKQSQTLSDQAYQIMLLQNQKNGGEA